MSLYSVDLDGLQRAAHVVRQHKLDLEERIFPELRAAMSADFFKGDASSRQQIELQEAMDQITRLLNALSEVLHRFEHAAQAISRDLKA